MAKFTLVLIALAASVATSLAQTCGQTVGMRPNRAFDPDGQRIVGGVEARPNSHPWIVSLQQYGSHLCGGSLIRVGNAEQSDIVVTAAHCVYDGYDGYTATAGAHDLTRPTSTQQSARAVRAVYHPQYNPDTTMNDIAIIKLDRPIKFTAAVQPVCLPSSYDEVAEGTEGTVAGWGLTQEGGYSTSSILLQVGVPIVNTRSCASSYASQGMRIDSSGMICAGYRQGGKDSCQGDSGGPFVFKSGSGYVLQGVVSFGVGCARPGLPGVYAKVANYLGWIGQQVRSLSAIAG